MHTHWKIAEGDAGYDDVGGGVHILGPFVDPPVTVGQAFVDVLLELHAEFLRTDASNCLSHLFRFFRKSSKFIGF